MKEIVLKSDNKYHDKLETAIKSISVSNRELKFYIFNGD